MHAGYEQADRDGHVNVKNVAQLLHTCCAANITVGVMQGGFESDASLSLLLAALDLTQPAEAAKAIQLFSGRTDQSQALSQTFFTSMCSQAAVSLAVAQLQTYQYLAANSSAAYVMLAERLSAGIVHIGSSTPNWVRCILSDIPGGIACSDSMLLW